MQNSKKASSQASWSILAQGVSSSRVHTHIVRSHFERISSSIDDSPYSDEIYRLIGDSINGIESELKKLERDLDRTNYALIEMGSKFYRQRLTHEDREMVDFASKYVPTPHGESIKKVSLEYLKKNH